MQLTPVQWGTVGSSFFYLFSIAAVLVGFAVNRLPTKWVIAAMALVWALTQFPMIGLVSLPVLIGCRILLGAGEGPAYPVALHAAYKWFPNSKRTLPTSIISIGAGVGVTIAAPILVDIIKGYSWHAAFGVLGVVGLVWVAAWILLGEEGTIAEPVVAADRAGTERIPYFKLLTCRSMLGILIAGFTVYWGLTMLVAWVPAFLQKGLGYDLDTTKWLVSVTWASSAIVAPLFGWLSQRAKLRGASSRAARAIPAGLTVTAAGLLGIIGLLQPQGMLQIALLVAAYSIGSVIYTLGPAMVGEITPVQQRGALLGITNAVYTIAGFFAPEVAGRLIAAGPTPHDGYINAFLLTGAIVVAGGGLALLLIHPEADIARLAARNKLAANPAPAE